MRETNRIDNVVSLLAPPSQEDALTVLTVAGISDTNFLLIGPGVSFEAQVAVSCLLIPEIGDTVLVFYGSIKSTRFIISVLARSNQTSGKVVLPGGNQIRVSPGKMALTSTLIELQGAEKLSMQAPTMDVTAHHYELRTKKTSLVTQSFDFSAIKVRSIIKELCSTANQLYLRAKSCFRVIEDFDDIQAGHQRIDVKGRYRLKSESVNLRAEGFVKIDGSKIDLG